MKRVLSNPLAVRFKNQGIREEKKRQDLREEEKTGLERGEEDTVE